MPIFGRQWAILDKLRFSVGDLTYDTLGFEERD